VRLEAIPWAAPNRWREANLSLEHHLQRHHRDLLSTVAVAERLKVVLEAFSALLEELCRATCAYCPSVCCRHATPWFDFRDLLFCHLCGLPPQPLQTMGNGALRCRYLGFKGCRLDRLQRPWVCLWYLCPTQKTRLVGEPETLHAAQQFIKEVKHLRRGVEDRFLAAIS
jgi:hypothetical protein